MQKKLLTMAVASALAMPAVALAQVTVYGSIDTGIKQQSKVVGVGTDDESKLTVEGQMKKTNRWGIKASEDLGGGLMANFNLEGGYDSDTGQMGSTGSGAGLFGRYAVVGLSSGGNSVNLGKDYTLNFRTHGIYDPLSHDYGGSAGIQGNITAGTRTNNSIMAAFRFGAGGVAVQYAPGEQAGEGGAGTYTAFNGDMTFGPVIVGAAFGSRGDTNPLGSADVDTTNVGGAYKMGAFTFRLGYSMQETNGGDENSKLSGGVQYDFSPTLTGRVSFYDQATDSAGGTEVATSESFIVNVEYSLSKRTLVYAVFDRKGFTGTDLGTTVGTSLRDGATGIGAGIVHNF